MGGWSWMSRRGVRAKGPRRGRGRDARVEGLEDRTLLSLAYDFASWYRSPIGDVMTANDVVVDGSGNSYVTGGFQGLNVDFDPDRVLPNRADFLSSPFYTSLYVAKFDPNGRLIWVVQRQADPGLESEGFGLTLSPGGDIFVTGGIGVFGFESQIYVDRLSPLNGSSRAGWDRSLGGFADDVGRAIAVDPTGSFVYVTGEFRQFFPFGPDVLRSNTANLPGASNEGSSIFFITLTADAQPVRGYVRGVGGSPSDQARGTAIASDRAGGVYLVGQLGPQGAARIYIDRIQDIPTTGTSALGFPFSPGTGAATGITVNAFGELTVVGGFTGTATFNPLPALQSVGGTDLFMVRMTSVAQALWTRGVGGSGQETAVGVATDARGDLYVAGTFDTPGTLDVDGGSGTFPITTVGRSDLFVIQLDDNGDFVSAIPGGGAGVDLVSAIDVNSTGDVRIVGIYQDSPVNFLPFQVPVVGPGPHVFVVGLSDQPTRFPTPAPTPVPPFNPAPRPPRGPRRPPVRIPTNTAPVVVSARLLDRSTIVVTYNQPMTLSTVQDPLNYEVSVRRANGQFVRLVTGLPSYRSSTRTVLIPLRSPAPSGRPLVLTIHANPPFGVTNASGLYLDGNRDGEPTGDFVARLPFSRRK